MLHTFFVHGALPEWQSIPASAKVKCQSFCNSFAFVHRSNYGVPPSTVQIHVSCHSGRLAKWDTQKFVQKPRLADDSACTRNSASTRKMLEQVQSKHLRARKCVRKLDRESQLSIQANMHPPLLWAMKRRLKQVDWTVTCIADYIYVAASDHAQARAHQNLSRPLTKAWFPPLATLICGAMNNALLAVLVRISKAQRSASSWSSLQSFWWLATLTLWNALAS